MFWGSRFRVRALEFGVLHRVLGVGVEWLRVKGVYGLRFFVALRAYLGARRGVHSRAHRRRSLDVCVWSLGIRYDHSSL